VLAGHGEVVVFGIVLPVVVGGDDDGGGDDDDGAGDSDPPVCSAGAGAGSDGGGVGSFTAAFAALVGGVVMVGAVVDGEVVGTGFVFGCADRSVSQSTALTDPKPTRNAATHASGITTARPPIRAKKEGGPSSPSTASIDLGSAPSGCGASVGASSSSPSRT